MGNHDGKRYFLAELHMSNMRRHRMFIRKVKIHNFKCYRDFEITLEEGLNIVVGDNEAGKSTILEAINLALTGIISGKSIWNEISQYIFNKEAVDEYIVSLGTAPIALPYITIEIFFGGDENPLMNGGANSDRDNSAEEPENHLSHTRLNQLIKCISEQYAEKQILISTHSSFVANKLGLRKVMLLENLKIIKFSELSGDTYNFFKKVAGYDTLRMILCKKAILCEGDSDELVIQKAYMQLNDGRLPIEDGIEVISVGVSFLRFLELADCIRTKIAVVTDNDGDMAAINKKYENYMGANQKDYIKICVDDVVDTGTLKIGNNDYNYNTLEPKLLKANGLDKLNRIFGTDYTDEDDLRKFMKHNKTECGLKIFESTEQIEIPEYILEAIRW